MADLHIEDDLQERLRRAASETGVEATALLHDAIVRYLEDLEDYRRGIEVLRRNEPTVTLDELERKLGLAD
jgi:predicted DNA-binding protein